MGFDERVDGLQGDVEQLVGGGQLAVGGELADAVVGRHAAGYRETHCLLPRITIY